MEDILKEIMSDLFEINPGDINDESSNETIETWTSVAHLNLIVAIEEKFGIEIAADEIGEMLSFKRIKEILRDKKITI
ncbi:MAG: acyl carrier protein [Candidatus Sigynarchaeota archaeon]